MSQFGFKFSNETVEGLRKLQSKFAEERSWDQFHTPRNLLLALVGEVGELADIFHSKVSMNDVSDWNSEDKVHLGEELSDILLYLIRLSEKSCIDLPDVTLKRMAQVKNSGSGTICVKSEGEDQKEDRDMKQLFAFSEIAFEVIRTEVQFLDDGVIKASCLQNIVLTIVKEVGELSELFQWKGEVEVGLPNWHEKERKNLEQELADVFMNLVYLSHRCTIDLPVAAMNKIIKNSKKYPIKLVQGCSKKYTEYKEEEGKLVVA